MSALRLRTILDLEDHHLLELTPGSTWASALTALTQTEKSSGQRAIMPVGSLTERLEAYPPITSILISRLMASDPRLEVSGSLVGTCSALSRGSPGRAVQWAHALAAHWARTGEPATMTSVLWGALDGRIPSDEGMLTLWAEQKLSSADRETRRGSDNWLDYQEAWTPEALRSAAEPPECSTRPS